MNHFIMMSAMVIASLTSIDVGLRALGFDFSKGFKAIRGYWDILAGVSGVLILVKLFMQ